MDEVLCWLFSFMLGWVGFDDAEVASWRYYGSQWRFGRLSWIAFSVFHSSSFFFFGGGGVTRACVCVYVHARACHFLVWSGISLFLSYWFECTFQVIDVGCCCGGLLNLCLKFCLYYTPYALVLIFSRSHLSFQFCNALILVAVTRKALCSCSECSR